MRFKAIRKYGRRTTGPGMLEEQRRFVWFELPTEIRLQILELLLIKGEIITLDPPKALNLATCRSLLRVSHRMHQEAYPVFYGANTFDMFPPSRDQYEPSQLLLARLPARYRQHITSLNLQAEPINYCNNLDNLDKLRLYDCAALRTLRICVRFNARTFVMAAIRAQMGGPSVSPRIFWAELLARAPGLKEVVFDVFSPADPRGAFILEMKRMLEEMGMQTRFADGRDVSSVSSHPPPRDMIRPEYVDHMIGMSYEI